MIGGRGQERRKGSEGKGASVRKARRGQGEAELQGGGYRRREAYKEARRTGKA